MSLLPFKTFTNPSTPLYASLTDFQNLSTSVQAINISTATGAGVSVAEPTLNNFVFTNALSNAGGISFVTTPGSSTLGLSNAGVTSVAVGTGLSTSGATGSITLANTGVTSVTAGAGILLGGTSTAPSITNTISASVNNVLDRFDPMSVPLTATQTGPGATTIVTWGSLIVGKNYLINFAGGLAANVAGTGTMFFDMTPTGMGSTLGLQELPCVTNTCDFATSIVFQAPQTSVDIKVGGDGIAGGTAVTGLIYNATIVQLD